MILFEMLTGALPWRGATAHEVAHARMSGDPPSPRARVASVDTRWDEVVRACLARDPAARPRSAAEVALALALA